MSLRDFVEDMKADARDDKLLGFFEAFVLLFLAVCVAGWTWVLVFKAPRAVQVVLVLVAFLVWRIARWLRKPAA